MKNLFDERSDEELRIHAPLAERMRPRTLHEFEGQQKIIGAGKVLRRAIERDELISMILWGPPGCGKTTLARIIALATHSAFVQFSAVMMGVADLKREIEKARDRRLLHRQRTVLFIDEIHRWNKAQQDALLPHVESGELVLIGATTENPSFEVIGPLLSRSRVFVLERLSPENLTAILRKALVDKERGLGLVRKKLQMKALATLVRHANGDARTALNALEVAAALSGSAAISDADVLEALQRPTLLYDKHGEEHYNVISAFIKSLRGSDADAGLYWLARMLEAGEDPLFIARRMVILASEDIGNADSNALPLAVAVAHAVELIGLPEAQLNLAQGVTYLANAPKSNASYIGLEKAKEDVRETLNEPVPLNLRNAVTDLMKDVGYGKGYKYSHDYRPDDPEQKQSYRPPAVDGHQYYFPKKESKHS